MNVDHVLASLHSLSPPGSRRGLLAGLTGGLMAWQVVFGLDEAAARKNGKHKRHQKQHARRKKRKNRQKADPIVRLDATCPRIPSAEIPLGGGGDNRVAQTFTPLATGVLVRAEMPISKDSGSSGDYILRISPTDAAGVPTNVVLADTVIANASVPDGESILSGVFATPAAVVAGATYALVLTRPGDDLLELPGLRGNRCGGQTFFSPDQTAPFAPLGSEVGLDLPFTTFVLA